MMHMWPFLNVKEGSSEARISRMLRHRHPSKDCSNVEDPRNCNQGLSPFFGKYPIYRKGCKCVAFALSNHPQSYARLTRIFKKNVGRQRERTGDGAVCFQMDQGTNGDVHSSPCGEQAAVHRGERHRGERISECKCPGTGQGTEDGKATAGNRPWFALMDEALGKSAAVTPPCLIASIQEEQPGPSTAQQVEQGRDEDEEDETVRNRRKDRAGHRGEKRRREREDPVLQLLKEDMKYQREADERREAEARERSQRFFSLLERLAEK
nr:uncharacterized protein LOC129432512 isoform X1 [Misgurnus anguillicaudatus]